MNLKTKKMLAQKVLKVGKERIVFLKPRLEEIKEAITRQDIRQLYDEGMIKIKEIKGRRKIVNTVKQRPKILAFLGNHFHIKTPKPTITAIKLAREYVNPRVIKMNKNDAKKYRFLVCLYKNSDVITPSARRIPVKAGSRKVPA